MDMKDMKIKIENEEAFKDAIKIMIKAIGEDPTREGLEQTPLRVKKAFEDWFGGYNKDPKQILNRTFPAEGYNDIIGIPNISFDSFCEHHITPIRGLAHVFYIPNNRIIGLDKIIKLVYMYARRLQTQEVMTQQIGDAMKDALDAKGIYVYIEAKHNCVATRETRSKDSSMLTTYRDGIFKENFSMENKALHMVEIAKKGGY
ncbi:MAG: putative GTP cyclohydrolase 1 [Prokaryotic dsDNA virus sp.]|jgi:GTP cyclohydrolase I|nr:MAG: putative GTP cyclohydrolase 1 [Prokaryotic dsDNA virus sp.]|tara:strand:+ start:4323 stop:4928 length:606 start_codon:yes stop_codon:yes gene_type:complete